MRYKVRFNSRDLRFLVVDTYQVDLLVAAFAAGKSSAGSSARRKTNPPIGRKTSPQFDMDGPQTSSQDMRGTLAPKAARVYL